MQDLAVNEDVARVLAALLPDDSKVVASLCHGPAAFMSAGTADGTWLFKGRKLTAVTDEEEQQVGLAQSAVWLLEERRRVLRRSRLGLVRGGRGQLDHRPEPGLGRRGHRGTAEGAGRAPLTRQP
ncbi:hypothetical protein [Amycolatopsis sp. NPDC098790]|uniref:hypothetical protein n=1 Tax=Amycolatopsis sp. NPDC098790 TaxID=3363939 RepID=UPI0037FB59ED